MTYPSYLTVTEAASRIRTGELSPVELMESLLSRTNSLEPKLCAWAMIDPEIALTAAMERHNELKSSGPSGPLHGIPVGIKDIFYTNGVPTRVGSPIYADFVPTYDATAVRRLHDAGAIIMGKTVTTQFACMDPPPTRNPWDQSRTPGGSSSGSAVGVAARMFPAALGSQTGGSVLRPASYNGIVGLKPTFGRISKYGVFPVAWSLDTVGVFSRTVEDASILLEVLSGHDPKDKSSVHRHKPSHQDALKSNHPPRVGLVRGAFEQHSSPEVWSNIESVLLQLREANATVNNSTISVDLDKVLAAHQIIQAVEAAAVHEKEFKIRPDDYGPKVRNLVEEGMLVPGPTYVQALRLRHKFRLKAIEAIRPFDVLIMPTTSSPAPKDLRTTGDNAFQAVWTLAGLPTIALPSGISKSAMPLSVQLIAAPFAETSLMRAALWCERVLDINLPIPMECV